MASLFPTFSFVIPAYNCGPWVGDAIESLVNQADEYFHLNVQVIVVDDGSTDDTAQVCQSYVERYPENIVLVRQEHQGACAARLRGLREATGDYVGFLDADDKWSDDICACAEEFFAEHPDVGICTARLLYFDQREGDHALAYKYHHAGVVDLDTTIDHPQLSMCSCIIKRELLDEANFDTSLVVSEDFLPMNRMLMRTRRYGLLKEPTYWYRKRGGEGGAIDNSTRNISWYLDTPPLCYQVLFDESKTAYGCVLPFLQYTVMYDLQWRIKDPFDHPLDDAQLATYRSQLVSLLQDIDTAIIFAQRNLKREQKVEAASLKFGLDFAQAQQRLRIVQGGVYWVEPGTERLVPAWPSDARERRIAIESARTEGAWVVLQGRLATVLAPERVQLRALTEGDLFTQHEAEFFALEDAPRDGFFEAAYFKPCGFRLKVPDKVPFRLELLIDGLSCEPEVKWAPGTEAAHKLAAGDVPATKGGLKRALRHALGK